MCVNTIVKDADAAVGIIQYTFSKLFEGNELLHCSQSQIDFRTNLKIPETEVPVQFL